MQKRRHNLSTPEGFNLKRIFSLGEPMIWMAGAAATLTLFMILLMLALVLFEGAGFFWPRDIRQVTLKDGSVHAGVLRAREVHVERDEQGEPTARIPRFQLQAGNRDILGADFVWIDEAQVAKVEKPLELFYVERQEWGPFIGRLEAEGGEQALADLAAQGRKRLAAIQAIEKGSIGSINDRMERLRLRLKALARRGQAGAGKRAQAELELKSLQERFEAEQRKLEQLKAEDARHTLTLRTVQGETKQSPVSGLVRVHQPNAMGVFGKAWVMAQRVWEFIWAEPRESNTEGGVFPAIFGTVLMSLLMTVVVVPLGVLAALYLREYAKQGLIVSIVRIAVNNLAGVPSIVFGVFGLGFFVYFVGGGIDRLFFSEALPSPTFGTGGILWASLTLALLTVPVVVVATEEALAFVPKGIRDGSLACGASKWQTLWNVVLPAAAPGILTGVILAMARGAGEVAPLMITGVVKLAPNLAFDLSWPFVHLERKFMHLGFHIYDVGFQSPNVEAAMPMVYTTTLLLILVIVGLNLGAMLIRNHLRKKYRSASF